MVPTLLSTRKLLRQVLLLISALALAMTIPPKKLLSQWVFKESNLRKLKSANKLSMILFRKLQHKV